LPKLFNDIYQRDFSENEVVWRYLKNPLQKNKITNCIAVNDTGEIVGHTAFIKHQFIINKTNHYGGLSVGSAVNKDYAGIFAPMYLFLEKYCENDYDFLYGYPNKFSIPFFLKLFKYKILYSNLMKSKQCISKNNNLNNIFQILVNYTSNNNSDFVRWRLTHNPINKYYYFSYNGGKIIWKNYNNETYIVGTVSENTKLCLEEKRIQCHDHNINIFTTDKKIYKQLKDEGFVSISARNTFIIKDIKLPFNYSHLAFQMLDVDIY
jgi:hypothetical protein